MTTTSLNRIIKVDRLLTYDVISCNVHFKMFHHNPNAKYESNRGQFLQILSGKDFYKQTIVVSIKAFSSDDTFLTSFPNIIVDYPLREMQVGNK